MWFEIGYLLAIFVGSMLGGAAVNLFLHAPLAMRIVSLENSLKGSRGGIERQNLQKEQEQELMLAIGEALEMHQNGASIADIVKEVGLKHPSVAMKLLKEVLSGKLKLPAGLTGNKGGLF